jgi:hypothetical protein
MKLRIRAVVIVSLVVRLKTEFFAKADRPVFAQRTCPSAKLDITTRSDDDRSPISECMWVSDCKRIPMIQAAAEAAAAAAVHTEKTMRPKSMATKKKGRM